MTAVSEFTLDFGRIPELERCEERKPVKFPVPVQVTTQLGVVAKAFVKVICAHCPLVIVQVPATSVSESVMVNGP